MIADIVHLARADDCLPGHGASLQGCPDLCALRAGGKAALAKCAPVSAAAARIGACKGGARAADDALHLRAGSLCVGL